MSITMSSLRGLPPKQVLALALLEKAARAKKAKQEQQALAVKSAYQVDKGLPPSIVETGTSLVLDPNHQLYDLIHKKADYKILWGGRASAKSWGVAEALIRLASASPITVLCTREYQVSIKHSSHKLLKQTINRLGLQSWFTVTADKITSRAGAEFMFIGLHLNESGLRSTEGIDICWVEEAQSVSENSWRSLLPTIRKDGAEVWITFNLMDEDDATYRRFVTHTPPNSIIHKLTYEDNPYLSTRSRNEMEADKLRDFHLYEHIWLGMPLKISNAVVFNGKYSVREFDEELWKDGILGSRLFFGMDFGFSQDPAAVMRMFPIEKDLDGKRRLYITHEAYAAGVELDDLPEFMDSLPDIRDWPIHADCSRPETISHLRRRGFAISGADKWDGCVKDGITHLRGFDEIVIHPRCTSMAAEARLYRYKTDPKQVDDYGSEKVLPIIVDKNNHGWDAVRYAFNGYIQRSGAVGMWERLAG